ncbi:carbohydrate porin [Escherichia coli]
MDANHEYPAGSRLRQRQSQQTGDTNNQYKITLAQQWQAGDSIWSRPAIRVFATYAKWDEKWGYAQRVMWHQLAYWRQRYCDRRKL